MFYQHIITTLATVLAVSAAPTVHDAAGTKVPLLNRRAPTIRGANGNANIPALLTELNYVLVKHSGNGLPARYLSATTSLEKRANSEKLTDQSEGGEDELYYGSGTVGRQTFTLDFDTGSSDLFVPGPKCGSSQGCVGNTKYDQKGKDEGNTTSITYGSGSVSGENYFDKVTIAGLTADKQNVISLTQAQGFSTSKSEGLLGMAFESIANSNQPPFFQSLINEGKVSKKEFAFYLGRAQSNTQGGSELTLGGRDTSKYTGGVTEVPVSSQTYWQVALDSVTVNGKAVTDTPGQAAIDTGTTLILAPSDAAAAIFAQIPGSVPLVLETATSGVTLYAYPCDYSGTIAIQFAGKQFKINALDLNFGSLTSDISTRQLGDPTGGLLGGLLGGLVGGSSGAIPANSCVAGIAGADLSPTQHLYVVGDTFLKNWYSIYSFSGSNGKPSVSFAAAAGNQ